MEYFSIYYLVVPFDAAENEASKVCCKVFNTLQFQRTDSWAWTSPHPRHVGGIVDVVGQTVEFAVVVPDTAFWLTAVLDVVDVFIKEGSLHWSIQLSEFRHMFNTLNFAKFEIDIIVRNFSSLNFENTSNTLHFENIQKWKPLRVAGQTSLIFQDVKSPDRLTFARLRQFLK